MKWVCNIGLAQPFPKESLFRASNEAVREDVYYE